MLYFMGMESVCSLEEKYALEHLLIIRESPKVIALTHTHTHTHTHTYRERDRETDRDREREKNADVLE